MNKPLFKKPLSRFAITVPFLGLILALSISASEEWMNYGDDTSEAFSQQHTSAELDSQEHEFPYGVGEDDAPNFERPNISHPYPGNLEGEPPAQEIKNDERAANYQDYYNDTDDALDDLYEENEEELYDDEYEEFDNDYDDDQEDDFYDDEDEDLY